MQIVIRMTITGMAFENLCRKISNIPKRSKFLNKLLFCISVQKIEPIHLILKHYHLLHYNYFHKITDYSKWRNLPPFYKSHNLKTNKLELG